MEIKTEKRENSLIITISGMLDASNYQVLDEAVQAEVQNGNLNFVFNLKNLEYMSSAGVRVFLKTYRAITPQRGIMAFSYLQPMVLEIFDIAGLSNKFQIYPDDEAALSAFLTS